MIYPKNELAQLVIHTCEENEIETVIISPGSRNAPLSIGFHNNKKINSLSIVDERCAAFFAFTSAIKESTKALIKTSCNNTLVKFEYYLLIADYFYNLG